MFAFYLVSSSVPSMPPLALWVVTVCLLAMGFGQRLAVSGGGVALVPRVDLFHRFIDAMAVAFGVALLIGVSNFVWCCCEWPWCWWP